MMTEFSMGSRCFSRASMRKPSDSSPATSAGVQVVAQDALGQRLLEDEAQRLWSAKFMEMGAVWWYARFPSVQ